jgi:hypothetical protein
MTEAATSAAGSFAPIPRTSGGSMGSFVPIPRPAGDAVSSFVASPTVGMPLVPPFWQGWVRSSHVSLPDELPIWRG